MRPSLPGAAHLLDGQQHRRQLARAHSRRQRVREVADDGIGRLAQVVANLLSNAVTYSPPDTPVTVTVSGADAAVVLEVNNRGPVIAPDVLAGLFNPFRRGDHAHEHSREAPGLGLGLYIVQQIVLAHGGAISARSTDADGTTFTVRLPRTS